MRRSHTTGRASWTTEHWNLAGFIQCAHDNSGDAQSCGLGSAAEIQESRGETT